MNQKKRRHGCLTAWLVLVILGNLLAAFTCLTVALVTGQDGVGKSEIVLALASIISVAGIVSAVALLRWRAWGFYGLSGASVALGTILMLGGYGVQQFLVSLLAPAILYALLQLGNRTKGWPQLE